MNDVKARMVAMCMTFHYWGGHRGGRTKCGSTQVPTFRFDSLSALNPLAHPVEKVGVHDAKRVVTLSGICRSLSAGDAQPALTGLLLPSKTESTIVIDCGPDGSVFTALQALPLPND